MLLFSGYVVELGNTTKNVTAWHGSRQHSPIAPLRVFPNAAIAFRHQDSRGLEVPDEPTTKYWNSSVLDYHVIHLPDIMSYYDIDAILTDAQVDSLSGPASFPKRFL